MKRIDPMWIGLWAILGLGLLAAAFLWINGEGWLS